MRRRERDKRRRAPRQLDPSGLFTVDLTQEEIFAVLEPTWSLWEDTTEDRVRDDEAAA